jgi:hypothetical protein
VGEREDFTQRWPSCIVRALIRHKLWGELWWMEGKYRWVFFGDLETSETYAEQLEYCPACGRLLERKNLRMAVNPAG